jgi:hypothetical protein
MLTATVRVEGVHTEHLLYSPVPSRFSGCWMQHTSLHIFDFLIQPTYSRFSSHWLAAAIYYGVSARV